MKPNSTEGPTQASDIQLALRTVGLEVTDAQARLLAAHAARVLEANRTMNLTRIVDPGEVLWLHIVDSLAFLEHVAPIMGRVVDIGSGAGYPGLPLAIMGQSVILCEPVHKKAEFLQSCIEALGLDAEVAAMRAEELAGQRPGSADVVVARAVSALASLVELSAPLLRAEGRLVALKGTPDEDEFRDAQLAAKICGMRLADRPDYVLPGGQARCAVVFERIGSPKIRLPRRMGMAQHHPLSK